ncbi:MAG: DUF4424 family protein [Nitrospirae bacterium]|nr:DUF4424 family protein [Nitrospirota bacterium]
MKYLLIFCMVFLASIASAYANDSAVESAAGGLKLRKEHSVLMKSERLFISKDLVRVEYEFINTTDKPVTSEVAFPIAPYVCQFDDLGAPRNFRDFKAWSDGVPLKVDKEVRAFAKGREVTDQLRKLGINIENFGDFDPEKGGDEFVKLSATNMKALYKSGALKSPGKNDKPNWYWPDWDARINYHWSQTFLPGKVVHITHEYKPVYGFSPVTTSELKDACMGNSTLNEIKKRVAKRQHKDPYSGGYFSATWVSYILTTANTWQTPIKDFELIVQTDKGEIVSFCWDGKVEKTSNGTYKARLKDFVPKKELKVFFLSNF